MTIGDNEPVISIVRVSDATEGGDAGVFRVSYPGTALAQAITVGLSYPTTTATAVAADFSPARPTAVVIPANQNQATFTVTASYDGVAEGTETVECAILANAAVYAIGTGSATLDVLDRIPTLTLPDLIAVREGGTASVVITSSFAPLTPITMAYTVTGNATPGTSGTAADYQTLSGTLTISGITTTLSVVTFADTTFDPFEEVIITLSEATPPTFVSGSAPDPLSTTVQIIDGEKRVSEVFSPAANGTYRDGDVIDIAVVFTQQVVVTGTPRLTLETGANDTAASYLGLSPDEYEVRFRYTVQPTDQSANLDYAGINALTVVGGTIRNHDGEDMSLTLPVPGGDYSLSDGANRVIAGSVPGGKPTPGSIGADSGGSCGLGSGIAGLLTALCMLAGLALSVRRIRR
jgi:hypothetical protein